MCYTVTICLATIYWVFTKTFVQFCNSFICGNLSNYRTYLLFLAWIYFSPSAIVSNFRTVSIQIDCQFVANQFRLEIIFNIRQILMMIFIWQPIDFLLLLIKKISTLSLYSSFGWIHPNRMSISICKKRSSNK